MGSLNHSQSLANNRLVETARTPLHSRSVLLKEMKTDFHKLIPELKDWNNGNGIDVQSWIQCVGSFQKAIGYSTMFWPEFVEIEGCVVRAGIPKESVCRSSYMEKYTVAIPP